MSESLSASPRFASPPTHTNGSPQQTDAAAPPSDPPPELRGVTAGEGEPYFPPELQVVIIKALPRSAITNVRLVCSGWKGCLDNMRADIALRKDVIEFSNTSSGIDAKRFNAHLKRLVDCHPATLNGALRDIARLLRYVRVEERQACFTALMNLLPHLPSAARRWLLCNLASRVACYQEGIARGDAQKLGFGFAQAILDATSRQPAVAQALIVAALTDGMDIAALSRSPLAEPLRAMAVKWGNGPFDFDAWAVLLVRGLANSLVPPDTQGEERFSLKQFGYYRIPLPAAKDGHQAPLAAISPGTAAVDASALCASILQSDLAWEEKTCLLMFRNYQGQTMLEDRDQTERLFVVLEELVDDTHTLEALIEASDESGSTLLNCALLSNCVATVLHWRDAVEPWLSVYAARIASSRKLPDDAKVRILRAGMRVPVAERSLLAKYRPLHNDVRFGPWREARFHGVSAIDSLYRNSTEYGLEAYMRVILNSPLSDEVKARVLCLDYPNRSGRPDMNRAHRKYCETVLASSLREDLKDSLLHGTMSDWKPSCSVM